ncbi:polysaccharide biosynthesis protein [Thermosipho atlanticus]|uniref:NDP-sugar epimerase, includes UDP-GlcNAc-inverting 4,6-dehydratase FlaA1 and capsular polysaccharide biosynthesis protein EpsC n=1 Tax=Thermosipho atlanticus DSM 15807 TaxID=1123380 RepID=A0A1M5QPW7_9BACT|nr:nucleoside-diphosphate sugar epimerase/dehydratase [Thermosipho atlanticus]SHH15891.1 NDP-sugar epimerase, includes UDP-GlcNAc-inverting 4,6-dehydratase FlaA1 and capsular polysaccharide biosynthesis protein EpsC [Thermosipho atlanticus DSM 15807]
MKRKLYLFSIDILATVFAGVLALFVRFGFDFAEMSKYNKFIYVYIVVSAIVYVFNGNYNIVWRYATSKDFLIIFRGTFISYVGVLTFLHFYRGIILPRSVGMLTFLGSFVLLIVIRLFYQHFVFSAKSGNKKIVIIGAGDAGVMIAREVQHSGYGTILTFLDDDPLKIGRTISGIRVEGPISRIMEFVKKYDIDEVIIAIPSATSEQIRSILKHIDLDLVKVRVLPHINELLKEEVKLEDIRDLSLEDIIGRKPVKVDLERIGKYLSNKVVMVTGAGGSIGSELCRQISLQKPKLLILLGRGENSIYEISEDLVARFENLDFVRVIGDVENEEWMEAIFKKFRPEIIFHAAAHKHVPLMEENPYEAIRVNVFGTINLVKLSCKYNVERFIFISTDKAVNPTSFMGLSKRIAELYVLSNSDDCKTKFGVVRFGNVLGSRGSVLWKFKRQIEQNKPVTITDPKMKRYFMSIPEAVSLVLEAGVYLKGKKLFVLDMGEQIPIENVAKSLAKLMGKGDIKIKYIGIRPGEKLSEELFYPYEIPKNTHHTKIFDIEYKPDLSREEIEKKTRDLLEKLKMGDIKEAVLLAKEIVPEFNYKEAQV